MHEIYELISELKGQHPSSKNDLVEFFRTKKGYKVIDSHNTASIIVVIEGATKKYALKIESSRNSATTHELRWYKNFSLPRVRSSFVEGDITEDFSYIVMEYIDTLVSLADAVFDGNKKISPVSPWIKFAFQADIKLHNATMQDRSPDEQFEDVCKKFRARMNEASNFSYLHALIESDTINVNDKAYISPQRMLSNLHSDKKSLKRLFTPKVGVIHGDLHIGNIACDTSSEGGILALDPGSINPLPINYDGGKILQSIHSGYEQIVRGQYSMTRLGKDSYLLSVSEVGDLNDAYQYVTETWEPHLLLGSLFMEAMHFLTMTPHHGNEADEATALYLTGVIRLNELSHLLNLN